MEPLSTDELQQGYALFYRLMSDESQVDGLLIIKSPSDPLPDLLKKIAATASAMVKEMDKWKEADPTLNLKNQGLPKVEDEARASIATMRTEQLLFHRGRYLDNVLTETQDSAANYAWHLAKVLADHEPDAARASAFAQWRDQWEALAKETSEILGFQAPAEHPQETSDELQHSVPHQHR